MKYKCTFHQPKTHTHMYTHTHAHMSKVIIIIITPIQKYSERRSVQAIPKGKRGKVTAGLLNPSFEIR